MDGDNVKNLVIIGSGPAGLTAALYAARAELQPVVIAGLNPGGQLMQTSDVENFPGFPDGVLGPDLMNNMIKQVERFGAKLVYENVTKVDFTKKPNTIITEKGEYSARTVIIATGAEANWLGLPNEQRLRGKGVSACATCDGFFFKGKDVVVIGGGDSAMEEANFLTKFASHVTLIHRRNDFRASKIMLKRAQDNPKISFITNATVVDVLGEETVTGVRLKDNTSGKVTGIAAHGYFAAIGHTPTTALFRETGIETDAKGYIVVKNNTRTSMPGVFVAGDVSDSRYRQAVSAAGMGCMAALDAEKYLAEMEGEHALLPEDHW